MTSDRIREIQETTGLPNSTSIYLALLQVWNECEQEQNERLKAEMFTLEDIERSFNAGVNSQFEVKALNKTDILDFHARKLHQLVLSIKPPKTTINEAKPELRINTP